MAGPKPILTDGRLTIEYLTDEPLTHKCQLDVNVATSGGAYFVLDNIGANYPWLTAVAEFEAIWQPLYPSGAHTVLATLYQRIAGVYQALASSSRSAPGTASGSGVLAGEATFTYRTSLYNLDKVALLGSVLTGPAHVAIAALSGGPGGFAKDFLMHTAGHVGNWYRAKDNTVDASGLFYTSSLNKKSRRRLGLV